MCFVGHVILLYKNRFRSNRKTSITCCRSNGLAYYKSKRRVFCSKELVLSSQSTTPTLQYNIRNTPLALIETFRRRNSALSILIAFKKNNSLEPWLRERTNGGIDRSTPVSSSVHPKRIIEPTRKDRRRRLFVKTRLRMCPCLAIDHGPTPRRQIKRMSAGKTISLYLESRERSLTLSAAARNSLSLVSALLSSRLCRDPFVPFRHRMEADNLPGYRGGGRGVSFRDFRINGGFLLLRYYSLR